VVAKPVKSQEHMLLALRLARKAQDKTYPNPMVGAVIVKRGRVIGRGYHKRAGADHAEVAAISSLKHSSRGATMYVTLEPCNHYGKTSPCTKAIIESGVKTVNIAMRDPNPINSGRGIGVLKKAGIKINVGLCEEEAQNLNRKYIKFITTGLPFVTLKSAQSLDGKIAARDGSSKWISCTTSRKYTRSLRPNFDAIMIGSGTLLKDNPYLLDERKKGYGVTRVVVDTKLKLSISSNIVKTAGKSPVIVCTTELSSPAKKKKLEATGVEVLSIKSASGKVPVRRALKALGKKGIVNVLVEGGGELVGSLVDKGLVDEVMFFISPRIIGGSYSSIKGKGVPNIASTLDLEDVEVKRSGEDIFVRGYVCSQA